MKKIVFLFVFVLCVTSFSYGQFALGIKVGYNANKLSTNLDTVKTQVNSGFHVGIWTRFGKRFYVAPELQYTMSGAVFSNEGNLTTNNWKQKITIGSLDIPVLVGFKIIHSDFITWRIELGPQASFIVKKKVEDENSILGPIKESSLSSMAWYVLGGTGIDILFLKLDIRYQYGLNQLIKDVQTSGSTSASFDSKNQMFVVSLGFKIFGKK
ncbi:MAG: porin family protein [Bacteroidota bacterium]